MSLFGTAVRRLARLLPPTVLERVLRTAGSLQTPHDQLRNGVLTMTGSLENMRRNGFLPGSVIDVGAHTGAWARSIHALYPDVPIAMIEASPDKDGPLAQVARELDGRAQYRIALLGSTSGASVPFHVVETKAGSGTGSSVFREKTGFEKSTLLLPTVTLDEVVRSMSLPAPYLLKLDVQGAELEVVRGASQVLASTEAILTEVSLVEYNEGAPLAAEVITELSRAGFALYDICSQTRRQTDGTLFQMDLIFVRTGSALRGQRRFWNHEPA